MTCDEFERLLSGSPKNGLSSDPYERLVSLSSELVKKRVTTEESFWNNIEPAERILFAVCSIIHVACDQGVEYFFERFGGSALALMTCANEGFEQMSELRYAQAIQTFLDLCRQYLQSEGMTIPNAFNPCHRHEYLQEEIALVRINIFEKEAQKIQAVDRILENGIRPESLLFQNVLTWVRKNEEVFKRTLCN